MSSYAALRVLFTRRDRIRILLLTLLLVGSGLLEVLGFGVLLPYISLLQNPHKLDEFGGLHSIYRGLGFHSHNSFSIAMSLALVGLFAAKAAYTLCVANYQMNVVYGKQAEIGRRLLDRYLRSRYEFFLLSNTSSL